MYVLIVLMTAACLTPTVKSPPTLITQVFSSDATCKAALDIVRRNANWALVSGDCQKQ
jgi:hypothetical protein